MNKKLTSGLKWVARAAAKEDLRPALHRLNVTTLPSVYGDDKLAAAAADGYRLHVLPLPDGHEMEPGLVDKKTFKPDDYDGRFPDFGGIVDVVAKSKKHVTIKLDTQELTRLVKLCGVLAKDSANSLRLEYSTNQVLRLSAKSKEQGDIQNVILCEENGLIPEVSEDFTVYQVADVSLNYTYLLDALRHKAFKNTVTLMLPVLQPGGLNPTGNKPDPRIIVGDVDNGFAVIMGMSRDTRWTNRRHKVSPPSPATYGEYLSARSAHNHKPSKTYKARGVKNPHDQDTQWHKSPASRKDTPAKAMTVPVTDVDKADRVTLNDEGVGVMVKKHKVDRDEWLAFVLVVNGEMIRIPEAYRTEIASKGYVDGYKGKRNESYARHALYNDSFEAGQAARLQDETHE